jgi:protein phosphatase 2C family protein 2/3
MNWVSWVLQKAFGTVKSFSANTNFGLIRQFNEDRIAIILNVIHPVNKLPVVQNWPNIQIFGIYDGHGGSKCAEYLKDNLHNNIINLAEFPQDIPKAIAKGSK